MVSVCGIVVGMNRYIVERTFPDGLDLPEGSASAELMASIAAGNSEESVSWAHSYRTADQRKTFCVYDAPSPEAVRRAAERNNLPVDRITEVTVIDP